MATDDMDPALMHKRMESNAKKRASDEEAEDADYTEELSAVTAIDIDFTDSRKKRFVGKFTFTVPTIGDYVRITNLKATMAPGGAGDANGAFLVEMMCFLQITLGENRPAWWQPHRFYDPSLLTHVYGRCKDYEARFRGFSSDVDGDDAQGAEARRGAEGDDAVERKVQPPAERRTVVASHAPRSAGAGDRARRAGGGTQRGG
jgi:hypothetical protein